jgi:NAD-dependent dihydropyrimidine dehydrogenase PreA subunit
MDKSCTEECPVDCTDEGDRKPYINPKEDIDSGPCEPAYPVEDTTAERRVAQEHTEFVENLCQFFTER